MIAAFVLAAVILAPVAPSPRPTLAATLPSVQSGVVLPYPASGPAQSQVTATRGDPAIPTVVGLDDATAIALMRVPSLAGARAEIDLEQSSLQLERTGGAPDITIAGSSTATFDQPGTSAAPSADTSLDNSTYSLSNSATLKLSQLIYDGGQLRAKIRAASLLRDAAVATYRRTAQTVAYDVASAYYQVLEDARTVAVDEALLQQNIVSENLVRAQIRSGTEAGADLATQVATTANARSSLITAQGILQNDRVAFATALGLDADIDVFPRDDSQGLETSTPTSTLPAFVTARDIAYVERPDLTQGRLTQRSAAASLRAAQRGLAPSVSFSGSKGLASTSTGGGSFRNNGTVGLDLTIPVFDQGITRANVASARASLAQDDANVATTRLTVQQDVREALIAIVSDRATLDQARAAYASSVTALRSTQGQYRVGVTTLPSLIQAQATLTSSATNIVNAIYQLQFAQANLRYAMGTIL